MISPSSALQPSDSSVVDAAVRYFDESRTGVDAFVADNFHWRGTIRLHMSAFGRDILRAPINVLLSPALILTRIMAGLCRLVRLNRGADWLRARRILLRTDVAGRVETCVVRDLLKIPLPVGRAHDSEVLARAILEAPQFRRSFRSKAGVVEIVATGSRITDTLAEYSSSRSAVADITTAIIALAVGAFLFKAVTPGMISMAPDMARSITLKSAVADFPLGQAVGSVWYGIFPTNATRWLIVGNLAGLVMVGSVIGAFAGVLADPVQAHLGIHRRRLLRFLAAIEDELIGSGTKHYTAREHYYARFMDLWDATTSALRFFRN